MSKIEWEMEIPVPFRLLLACMTLFFFVGAFLEIVALVWCLKHL